MHTVPKNNPNLRLETEHVTARAVIGHIKLAQKHDIYRCIRSNRDMLGFYAVNQMIFGTVFLRIAKCKTVLRIELCDHRVITPRGAKP